MKKKIILFVLLIVISNTFAQKKGDVLVDRTIKNLLQDIIAIADYNDEYTIISYNGNSTYNEELANKNTVQILLSVKNQPLGFSNDDSDRKYDELIINVKQEYKDKKITGKMPLIPILSIRIRSTWKITLKKHDSNRTSVEIIYVEPSKESYIQIENTIKKTNELLDFLNMKPGKIKSNMLFEKKLLQKIVDKKEQIEMVESETLPDDDINEEEEEVKIKDGPWKSYYENGNLMIIGTYRNLKKVGEWKSYREDGSLNDLIHYTQNGVITVSKSYHWDGSLIFLFEHDSHGKTIQSKSFYKSKKVRGITTYENDEEKQKKNYYETGELKGIGNYVNGEKDGDWKWFYKNGDLFRIQVYKNGEKLKDKKTTLKNNLKKQLFGKTAKDWVINLMTNNNMEQLIKLSDFPFAFDKKKIIYDKEKFKEYFSKAMKNKRILKVEDIETYWIPNDFNGNVFLKRILIDEKVFTNSFELVWVIINGKNMIVILNSSKKPKVIGISD